METKSRKGFEKQRQKVIKTKRGKKKEEDLLSRT